MRELLPLAVGSFGRQIIRQTQNLASKKLFATAALLYALLAGSSAVAQCINTSPYGSGTVGTTNITPVSISTCNYPSEYATVTVSDAGNYIFASSVSTDYITVTDASNTVISHGPTPHTASITTSGTYRMHITLDASCNTGSGCRASTVAYSPCVSTTSYLSGSIGASNTTPITFGTCWWGGEFVPLTIGSAGAYEFTSGVATDILTLTDASNVPITSGASPLLVNVPSAGSYRLHVFATATCGAESLCRSLSGVAFVPLCGTYTIDGSQAASSTNFTSFGDFASAISTLGVSCPVTVNVKQGTYTGQVSFGAIPGASATNTVTIQSDPTNTSPVTLTYAPTGFSDNFTLALNGAGHIAFSGITFESTGATYSRIVQLNGTCTNIAFDGNTFNAPVSTSSTTNKATFYYVSPMVYDGLSITNNTFNNNAHVLYLIGTSSNPNDSLVFDNNTCNGFYGYGIYVGYTNRSLVRNNVFTAIPSTSSQYGVYSYTGSTAPNSLAIVENNTIQLNTTSTFYGIYNNYLVSTAANPSRYVNNMISNAATTGTGTRYGIYPYACSYINIYHNSISVLDGSATSGRALYFNTTGTTYGNIDVRNNIVSNTGNGYVVEISSTAVSGSYVTTLNNNVYNFTSSNTSPLRYNNSNSADLAAWQLATSFDANSVSGDPIFTSATDLHVIGTAANDAGDNSVGVTTDIDGDTRPASGSTTVDIGADEYTPSSCSPPSGLTAYAITSNSAMLTWTSGGASNWMIQYDTAGFTPGTGNFVAAANDTVMLSGLLPQTSYDVYVKDSCSATSVSPWFGPVTFTTACTPFTAPFTENFDGLALVSPYTDLPACWEPQVGPDFWDVTDDLVNTGHTYLPNIGDHTTGTGNYMWIDASSDILGNAMITGLVDISGLTSPYAGIWFASNNTTNSVNHTISLDAWDGAAWVNVATQSGNFPGWVEVAGLVPSTVPSITKFRIMAIADPTGTSSTYFYNDLGVDDFFVIEAPSCVSPTSLTAIAAGVTDLTFGFVSGGASHANYQYGAAGFSLGSGTYMTTTNDTVTITGLTSNTAYDIYVRDSCGVGNTSAWVGPLSMSTLCNPYTIPYFEGFESGYSDGVAVGGCLSQESVAGTSVWTANTSQTSFNRTPYAGSWNAFLRYGNERWLFIPIDLVGSTSYTFNAFVRQDGSTLTNSDIMVAFGSSASGTAMTDTIVPVTGLTNGNYQQITGLFTPATSGTYYVGIKGYMNFSPWYISLDDISIDATPTCPPPLSLMAMATSSSTATAYWNSTAATFQVEYGTTGFTQGQGTVLTVTNDTVNLTGLTANTNYQFYVRAICAAGDTSGWAGPSSFFTGYCTPAPSSVDGQGITNVTMGSINNTTGAETGNYGDYTNLITNAALGSNFAIDVTYQTGYTYDTWVWVDWNDDLDFLDAGEANYLGNSSSANPTTLSGSITIPAGAPLGNHRMRIGGADFGLGTTPPSDPCFTGSYAAFEDYTINVIVPLNAFALLSPPDNATLLVAGPAQNTVSASWQSAAAGAMYEWRAFLPGGSVNNPALALASDNGGMDTTLTLTIGQLDAVLASLGVNIGDTATINWNVKAMFGADSLFGDTAFALNLVRLGTSQANLVTAPVGGSGTTGLSAPAGTATAKYFRAAMIVTAAEYANANVPSGEPLRSVGFSLNAPASGSVQGIMKVYLLNTTDAGYLKGNIWDTIVSDMIQVYSDTITIAAGAVDYHMEFTTNFSYGGNNVYVAYDWEQISTPLTTGLVYRANTSIASSIRRQASATAPPATLTSASSFRPELFWGIDKEADDLAVNTLWAQGKTPVGYGTPEEIAVIVRNNGYLPANKMVTLNVTGANTFTASAMVSLPSEADTILTFSLNGTTLGFNTITASVPADDVTGNNSKVWVQQQTTDTYGYADTAVTGLSSVGYNTGSGLLLSRFDVNGSAVVTDVRVNIGNNAATAGQTVYGVVVDAAGNIVAQSANLVVSSSDLGTWVTFPVPASKIFTNESFWVGLAQTVGTAGYFPVSFQSEDPTRPNAYYTAALSGGTLSTVNGFRLLIEAVVDTPPACIDPVNLAAIPGCNDAILTWDSDTLATSSTVQWGLQGFTPGTGNFVYGASSPQTISGLALGTSYDFWVIDTCFSGNASNWVGPYTFTTDTLPIAVMSANQNASPHPDTVQYGFSALGSSNGTGYWWDFGDGSANDTNMFAIHNYGQNGTYTVTLVVTNNCGSDTTTQTIVVSGIGIDEHGFGNIGLYPNPNDGYFTLTGLTDFGSNAKVEVITATGMIVYSRNIVANGSETFTIDLRGYAPGIYQVRISSNKGVGTKPFVLRN